VTRLLPGLEDFRRRANSVKYNRLHISKTKKSSLIAAAPNFADFTRCHLSFLRAWRRECLVPNRESPLHVSRQFGLVDQRDCVVFVSRELCLVDFLTNSKPVPANGFRKGAWSWPGRYSKRVNSVFRKFVIGSVTRISPRSADCLPGRRGWLRGGLEER
jgi:hypothetical protein